MPAGKRIERAAREVFGGEGVVQRYESGTVVVLFDSVGCKKLGLDMVMERGLLSSV
jgi:hypothetical protein